MLRTPAALFLSGLAFAAAGCAGKSDSAEPSPVIVSRYAAAFDAAKVTLRDQGFILERVDAAEGVITTRPKDTAGIATPWHREQQTVAQEFEDLAQRHQRIVRVTFERGEDQGADQAVSKPLDGSTSCRVRVHVTMLRLNAPGQKLEPEAIRQSSMYTDPNLVARGMQPQYAVAWKQDERLAARLTEEIERRAARGGEVAGTEE